MPDTCKDVTGEWIISESDVRSSGFKPEKKQFFKIFKNCFFSGLNPLLLTSN